MPTPIIFAMACVVMIVAMLSRHRKTCLEGFKMGLSSAPITTMVAGLTPAAKARSTLPLSSLP